MPQAGGAEGAGFAVLLRRELNRRGLSQRRLAEMLELDQSTISLWVAGRQAPRPDNAAVVRRLAGLLRMEAEELRGLLRPEGGSGRPAVQAAPPAPRRLRSRDEVRRVLEQAPYLLAQALPVNGRVRAETLREKLLEHGYDADLRIVGRALDQEWVQERLPPTTLESRAGSVVRVLEGPGDDLPRDGVRQACRAFNVAFEAAADQELSGGDLLGYAASRVGGALSRPQLELLLERLIALRLLESAPPDRVTRRWVLNPEYVINKSYGLRTDVPGLEFLLDGGLLPPEASGFSLLVRGRPGTGKTMLALHLAASIAAQGHLSLYFSAEEDPRMLLERLSFAGYGREALDRHRWRLTRDGELEVLASDFADAADEAEVVRRCTAGKGTLWLVSLPNRRAFLSGGIQDRAGRLTRALARKRIHTCIVLDSVDWVVGSAGRDVHEGLFQMARLPMGIGVFVSELHRGDEKEGVRDYLADVVIRLDYRRRAATRFSERVIEVEKCRTQFHVRGEHPFAIIVGKGIQIDPSVQSMLSLWRRRVGRRAARVESWKVDESLDLDRILRGDVVQGSTILLSGPPSTHKFNLGLAFLASGLLNRPAADPPADVILVSLREDEEAIRRIIKTYPQLAVLLDPDGLQLAPRLRVIHLPADYFTAERLLHWLRYAVKGRRVSRLMLSNLAQLQYSSPVIHEEKLAISGIIQLLRRKGITALFIGVGREDQEKGEAEVFDTLMFTDHQDPDDPESVVVRVSHSGPCNADRQWHRLERRDRRLILHKDAAPGPSRAPRPPGHNARPVRAPRGRP